MRKNILLPWHKNLRYIIREIVQLAKEVEKIKPIYWENIWDPVEKGEPIPDWMKQIIKNACEKDEVYWYSPTRGHSKAINYLISQNPKLKPEDIIFFNWIWDAISKIYKALSFDSRIIGPNPAYPTHSSSEAAHANSFHLTYKLDPENNWYPDLEELENKVKYNPNIVGILVINPDNPTWAVFPKEVLKQFVKIAKKYNLFLIFDEIYEKLVFNPEDKTNLSDIIEDVPWISMKWISKDLPWPGGRCGRIEVYNQDKDPNFKQFVNTLLASKMVEVCSTTLPQYVLPDIYQSEKFKKYLNKRIEKYKKRAQQAQKILWQNPYLKIIPPKGAFYLTVLLNLPDQTQIKITDSKTKELISPYLEQASRIDEKFCYGLLWETGVCVVPLSGFNTEYNWFRMTLLEENDEKFEKILNLIDEYTKNLVD